MMTTTVGEIAFVLVGSVLISQLFAVACFWFVMQIANGFEYVDDPEEEDFEESKLQKIVDQYRLTQNEKINNLILDSEKLPSNDGDPETRKKGKR